MTISDSLRDANNAILDLQQADYNTFQRPLKRLASALGDTALSEINAGLKEGLDFDKFVQESDPGGGMLGSAELKWPDDKRAELGLSLLLIERGAADPDWFVQFGHEWYFTDSKLISGVRKMTSAVIIPFLRDYKIYIESLENRGAVRTVPADLGKVFIVHGHDIAARETAARFIASLGLEPVILHEQPNKGMTIPEKLSAYSEVGFALVLLTPDDVGRSVSASEDRPRARQNVVLELGYFVGYLGRDRVCALKRGDVEIPTDYLNVAYTEFDEPGAWKQTVARELRAVGYEIDWNRVMQ